MPKARPLPKSDKPPVKRLTTALPEDVWDRLDAEAQEAGRSIGLYLRDLIVRRDQKKHGAGS